MLFLTDVDGVLLNWMAGFEAFIRAKGIPVSDDEPQEWDLEAWFKEKVDIRALVQEFNHSPAFAELPCYPDALMGLRFLCGTHQHRIVAITSCSDLPQVWQRRQDNLVQHFGEVFDQLICLPLGESKLKHLKRFEPTWWIEDKPEGALAGHEAGHRSMLITRPWNVSFFHPDIRKHDDWHEIAERIIGTSPALV